MPRGWQTAMVLFMVLLTGALIACGDSGPTSFVGKASNSVIFVEWTREGSRLEGTFRQALIKPGDPTTVDENAAPLSGTVSGSDVTLRIGGELLGRTMTGKLDGSTLELRMDGAAGGILDVKFEEGESDDYNAGLANLQADADQAIADQAAAEAEAEQAQEVVANAGRVRADMDAIDKAAEDLKSGSSASFDGDLDTIRGSLETVKQALELVKQDVQAGETEVVCSDADVVKSDAEVLEGDIEATVGSSRDVSSADAGSVRKAIRELRASFGALQAADPALVPADAPTQADVDATIIRARRAIKAAGGSGSRAMVEAEKLLDQAQAYVAEAQALCDQHGQP